MKIRLMEDNSLTYELYLPNDGKFRIATTLGDGSKDYFVISLNKTEVTLENYIKAIDHVESSLKTEGEYILINKNLEERTFKIRKYIFDKNSAKSIIPIEGKFQIEYQNEESKSSEPRNEKNIEVMNLGVSLNKRELRRLSSGDSTGLKNQGIGLYVIWTLLSYMMLITGRYMKYFYLWRMFLHTVLGIIILILSIIFESMADEDEGASSSNTVLLKQKNSLKILKYKIKNIIHLYLGYIIGYIY